ncbi:MAG TPA: hypothetical protein VNN80_27970 [Polyangiaceae bacterium]|jgi:hypothetical protein|nr:hypothetical protein [Polyangiaceae bacterium]
MSTPSTPSSLLADLRLPKAIDSEAAAALLAALRAGARPLWAGGVLLVPTARWTPHLVAAIEAAQREGRLVRGLEQAEKTLAREARGLSLVDARSAAPRGARVSRLLLVSNDGSPRFYREVERLVAASSPRLLPIRVDADSNQFVSSVPEPSGVVRALLIEHKELVAAVLLALYRKSDP